MKALIQRVKKASVTIDGELYSQINQGILILLGVEKGDTEESAEKSVNKIINLRIFPDAEGKMNRSLKDTNGELLVVSQFTLCGNCKKGTRPSFDNAELPEKAKALYEKYIQIVKNAGAPVATGSFGAMMDVELINDGPVTFMVET